MKPESFLNDRVTLWAGDCLTILARIEEGSVDSCVCDPPYHLTSIVKRFGKTSQADETLTSDRARKGADGMARLSRGFMGKVWDGGDVAFRVELWAEVFRVLKPGAHLVAFSGTRTYHRMVCAIEDAGFEIRDQIGWAFGSGFPKSMNVAKMIDKKDGRVGFISPNAGKYGGDGKGIGSRPGNEHRTENFSVELETDAAREWQGWGTALKPAWEPCVLARKPLIGTVAQNVIQHGTGALNIDGCRVETFAESFNDSRTVKKNDVYGKFNPADYDGTKGRWPANVITDGSEEVVAAFPETQPAKAGFRGEQHSGRHGGLSDLGANIKDGTNSLRGIDDSGGSAARFFYTAKADADDRLGSKHPTVKPLDLMQYLVRLVTPPGGLVLDPFAGTGTTGEAAWREGMRAVLIEREEEYQNDIRRRMKLALGGPEERKRESIKASGKAPPLEDLPLFEPAYDAQDDFAKSLDVGYAAIRERVKNGGPGWTPGGSK